MCDFELTESDIPYAVGCGDNKQTPTVPPNKTPVPWSCPHPADGENYCVFHRGWVDDPPTSKEIVSAFTEALADPERPNEFVGLRCDNLEFDSINLKVVGEPRQIRLEHAFVSGRLSFKNTVVPTDIELSFAQCANFEFVESTVNGNLLANGSDLGEGTEFENSTINGELECSDAWLGVHFFGGNDLVIRDDASFIGTVFGYPEGRITSEFVLSDSTIGGDLLFHDTRFSDEVHLEGTTVDSVVITDASIYDIALG